MDLYRRFGTQVSQLQSPSSTADAASAILDVPGTVITKVVETTDEQRSGVLLQVVAP